MSELDKPVWMHLDYRDDFEETYQVYMTAVDQELYDPRPTAAYDVNIELGERRPETFMRHPASIFMRKEAIQRLFDDMWRLGFRPRGDATPGQLAAQQEHLHTLKDVATRLFNLLEERIRPIYHIENNAPLSGATEPDPQYVDYLRREVERLTNIARQGGTPNVRNERHP